MKVTVTGGADGTTAHTEDLLAMARVLGTAAASLRDVVAELDSPRLAVAVATAPDHDPAGGFELRIQLGELAGPFGPIAATGAGLAWLGSRVALAAFAYGDTENSLVGDILGGIGDFALGAGQVLSGNPVGGADAFMHGLPGLTAGAAEVLSPLSLAYADSVPDGRAVLHALGPDARPEAHVAPRSLADLVTGLSLRNSGHHGEVSVCFVIGADGRRRAIVDITGTKSWNPVPNRDVTSVGTDIRAMAGRDTSYEEGVFAAMQAAGVTRDTEVMLVGHSEGGTVAVNAARDAARTGRFRVTHVVTAGSPIGRVVRDVPNTVQVLALENRADIVPATDAATNPDRRNVTTVTVDDEHYSMGDNHDLDATYEPAAQAADNCGDRSVDAFVHGARGFLDGERMQTDAYWITRDT